MGVYGESVVLPCTFPVGSSWDADSSVIMWQRHLEVVHSFFHGRDQRAVPEPEIRQPHQPVPPGDEARNALGSGWTVPLWRGAGSTPAPSALSWAARGRASGLKVAAFYPEPRLHISMLNDGHVEVVVTSEGGYPSPSLQWLMGNESDVTNDTLTQLRQDEHTRLYSVNSKLNLSGTVKSSITFIMRNPDLGQEIRRNIELFSENGGLDQNDQRAVIIVLCVLGVGLFTVIISVIVLLRQWKMKKHNPQNTSQRTIESSEASSPQTGSQISSADEVESVTETLIKEHPRRDG
ncbi:hypothetical protein AMELA_G00042690 [Ameiurus melas]|uniref:Butyrophilin subfamily 3 member A2-like Ig-C domain-containing protein n=1 Tax=Ameiurus melas TaxID=219545 RepID=A0A7J6B447_AMEME|nr:hypothetical protein AMELA_G00042690 [Ameiurus melas]